MQFDKEKRTYIIAEAGVNHNGNIDLARQLVDAAVKAGADAVKFQMFQTALLVHPKTPTAVYQQKQTGLAHQFDLIQKLELSSENFIELKMRAETQGIDFLTTPFDLESLNFLISLGVDTIKVSSGDLTYAPFLLRIAQQCKKVILSTGMSSLQEIREALCVLAYGFAYPGIQPKTYTEILNFAEGKNLGELLVDKVTILHCTSEYPAPFAEVNINALNELREQFGLPVGYSDHTSGTLVPVIAVAQGASIIEKHFTLDNTLVGPDHAASLDISSFAEMVKQIRLTEMILGDGKKRPMPSELMNKLLVRRGLYAARPIPKGTLISQDMLCCLRPEGKTSPTQNWDLIGSTAEKDIAAFEAL